VRFRNSHAIAWVFHMHDYREDEVEGREGGRLVKFLFSGLPASLHLHLVLSEAKCSEHTTSLFHVQKEFSGLGNDSQQFRDQH
jgi:hypothetical protein